MAAKKNTQKILLALFTPEQALAPVLTQEQLRPVVAEMTDSGFRSLLMYLEKQNRIYKQRVFSQNSYGLTSQGREELDSLFPALQSKWQSWDRSWMLLTFLEAPKSDPHFRYLRSILLKEQALALTRGVFIKPDTFTSETLRICQELYRGSVAIGSVQNWQMGVDNPLVSDYYDLSPLAEVYSSISKESSLLLSADVSKKGLIKKDKYFISSIFDRFADALGSDVGLLQFYVPGVAGAQQIQSQLQRVLFL